MNPKDVVPTYCKHPKSVLASTRAKKKEFWLFIKTRQLSKNSTLCQSWNKIIRPFRNSHFPHHHPHHLDVNFFWNDITWAGDPPFLCSLRYKASNFNLISLCSATKKTLSTSPRPTPHISSIKGTPILLYTISLSLSLSLSLLHPLTYLGSILGTRLLSLLSSEEHPYTHYHTHTHTHLQTEEFLPFFVYQFKSRKERCATW